MINWRRVAFWSFLFFLVYTWPTERGFRWSTALGVATPSVGLERSLTTSASTAPARRSIVNTSRYSNASATRRSRSPCGSRNNVPTRRGDMPKFLNGKHQPRQEIPQPTWCAFCHLRVAPYSEHLRFLGGVYHPACWRTWYYQHAHLRTH